MAKKKNQEENKETAEATETQATEDAAVESKAGENTESEDAAVKADKAEETSIVGDLGVFYLTVEIVKSDILCWDVVHTVSCLSVDHEPSF